MERRRERIIQAAVAVLEAPGTTRFTAEQVAEQAGVSRRTVLNYFPKTDDLLVAAGSEMMSELLESVKGLALEQAPGSSDPSELFEELAGALRNVDIVAAIIRLSNALGTVGQDDPRVINLVNTTILQLNGSIAEELRRRHPECSPLEIDLLTTQLVGGIIMLYKHWALSGEIDNSAQSRQRWQELLEVLLENIRSGYVQTARQLRSHSTPSVVPGGFKIPYPPAN